MRKTKVKQGLVVLMALIIAIFVIAGTYARYSTSGLATVNAGIANWQVAITDHDGQDLIETERNLTFQVIGNENVVAGKVAPGVTARSAVVLDLTGTEVAVDFDAVIGNINETISSSDKMSMTTTVYDGAIADLTTLPTTGGETLVSGVSQLINLVNDTAFTASNGIKTVVLDLTWVNDDNNNVDDTTMGTSTTSFTFPVILTAKQHIISNATTTVGGGSEGFFTTLNSINQGGTITLADSIEFAAADYPQNGYSPIVLPDNSVFDLNQETVTGVNAGVVYSGNNITIKNGTFQGQPDQYGRTYTMFYNPNGTKENVTLEDIVANGGINGCDIQNLVLRNVTSSATKFYSVFGNPGTTITIESGTYTASNSGTKSAALFAYYGYDKDGNPANPVDGFKIMGGTFLTNTRPFCLQDNNYIPPVIYGGNFDTDVSSYCADGYSCNFDRETGYYVVSQD